MAGFRFFSFGSSGKKAVSPTGTAASKDPAELPSIVVARPQPPPSAPQPPSAPPDPPDAVDALLRLKETAAAMELLKTVTAEEKLAAIAYRCQLPAVAAAAAEKVSRFELILKILRNTADKKVGHCLLDKLTDPNEIRQAASSARSPHFRRAAEAKLQTVPTVTASPAAAVDAESEYSFAANKDRIDGLENLCTGVEKLFNRYDEAATAELDALRQQWVEAPRPPPRFMEILEKRFHQAENEFARLAEVARQRERQQQEAVAALTALAEAAEKLIAAPSSPGRSTAWRKLKNDWDRQTAVAPPPEEVRTRYLTAANALAEAEAEAEAKRQTLKHDLEQLQAEITQRESSPALRENAAPMKELRTRLDQWEADAPADLREQSALCRQLFNRFFAKLKDAYAAEEYERCANLVRKQDLCLEAEKLQEEPDIPKLAAVVKTLHARWREIGPVPRESEEAVNLRFRERCDELHRRCDEYYNRLREERLVNLTRKQQLATEAESLQESTDWHQATEKVKQLQADWKAPGPGPKEEEPSVYQWFKTACDQFFSRRREHLEQLKQEWDRNAAAKQIMIEAAAKLLTMDPRAAIAAARDLRKQWKEAPAADHRTEQQLWEQFNGNINRFFAELDTHQQENIDRKEALCIAAAELVSKLTAAADAPIDFPAATRQIDALLEDWRNSGPVPKAREVEIWSRFEAALKPFYDLRRTYAEQWEAMRRTGTEQKQQLLVRLEEILAAPGRLNEDAERIKALQHEWKEAGAGLPDQEQELWERFHSLCDGFFNRRNQAYEEYHREQQENYRKKVELCVRLEKLAGIEAPPESGDILNRSTLAQELTVAFQSGVTAALDRRQAQELAKTLCEEWRHLGFSGRADGPLQQRFNRARNAFFTPESSH